LADGLKMFVDLELYDADQMIRMEATRYPDAEYNVEVPLSLIEAGDLEAIKQLSSCPQEDSQEDSQEAESDEPTSSNHFEFYEQVTKEVRDEPAKKKSTAKRKVKATQQARKVVNAGICDDSPAPCVNALAQAIAANESIGFMGRNKLISEMTIIGNAEGLSGREIENRIVEAFLTNGNPHRYGVLEEDYSEDPSPSGFRLRDDFSLERLNQYDISCSACAQWCDVDNCYRANDFLSDENSPSFDEYRGKTQAKLTTIMNDPYLFADIGILNVS
jgi:hypothetical protein